MPPAISALEEAGANATSGSVFSGLTKNAAGGTANIQDLAITSQSGSNETMFAMDAAVGKFSNEAVRLDAPTSRSEFAPDNLINIAQNTADTYSGALDADYASETTALARIQIPSRRELRC